MVFGALGQGGVFAQNPVELELNRKIAPVIIQHLPMEALHALEMTQPASPATLKTAPLVNNYHPLK